MMFLLSTILGSRCQYEIQPLRENAGLFYEKLESIRLTQNYWRIVIFLDVGNISQQIHQPNLLQDINQVYNNCLQKTAMKEDCRFIGSIFGPIVGLLTSEDGKEYTNAINELNDRQSNLSRIMKQQTHIIGAELQNIHEELHLRNTAIQELQTTLTETIKNIHKQEKIWN